MMSDCVAQTNETRWLTSANGLLRSFAPGFYDSARAARVAGLDDALPAGARARPGEGEPPRCRMERGEERITAEG